jgi:uncharacterized protein (TIGR03083 family)
VAVPTATFDRSATLRALDAVAERLIELVTSAPDPTVRVPATPAWTVAEVLAHVVTVAPRYHHGPYHRGEWVTRVPDLSDLNERQMAALGHRDISRLATELRASLATLAADIEGFADAQPVYRFHGGEKVAADVALGILLGELVVHGHDIARALGRPWTIEPAHVELVMRGITPIVPGWLHPERSAGHTARYEVRVRGQGVHTFDFSAGRLAMNPADGRRPDVVISGDAATLLLLLYRRIGHWPAVASGRLAAWGRRPWLALSFVHRFYAP